MLNHQAYQQYLEETSDSIRRAVDDSYKRREEPRRSYEAPVYTKLVAELDNKVNEAFSAMGTGEGLAPPHTLLTRPPKNLNIGWSPDYMLPMFAYSKQLGKNPAELAQIIAEHLKDTPLFSKADAAGPYINLLINDHELLESLKFINESGSNYGRLADTTNQVAVIDYSAPNIAKPFGINHLSSTVLGEALSRLFDALGYTVVRDNHLGDWGTQFGNLLAAHELYAPDRDFNTLNMDELNALYVRFSKEKKESQDIARLGQSYFARLEGGDPKLIENWWHAYKISMEEFEKTYKRLDVHFDTQVGEGYFVELGNQLVDKLLFNPSGGIIQYDPETKAVIIQGEHPVVVRTGDGYGVYAARDLATIAFRVEAFEPAGIIYVVGEEQASYFRTVFEAADKTGLNVRNNGQKAWLEHVGFGLLLDKDGKKLSTRKGTSGKLSDLIDTVDKKAFEETKKRNPEMPDEQIKEISSKVAVGAIVWNNLRTDRLSSVRLDIDKMLELGGDSIIDVLYTYTRSSSILKKLGEGFKPGNEFPEGFSTEEEHQMAVRLGELGEIIRKSCETRSPHILAGYLAELSQMHGRFYEGSRVLGLEDQKLANLRIELHAAYKTVVGDGLRLLNIPLTEKL